MHINCPKKQISGFRRSAYTKGWLISEPASMRTIIRSIKVLYSQYKVTGTHVLEQSGREMIYNAKYVRRPTTADMILSLIFIPGTYSNI